MEREGLASASGFTVIEMLLSAAVGIVLAAFAIPSTLGVMSTYRLRAAATNAAMAIQATRYQAIMQGYPYQITFSTSTNSYRVLNKVPPATTFSNVAAAVPLDGSGSSTVSQATTLQFSPGGTVTATQGSLTFTISNSSGTKTITVSSVGNVSVTP